MRHALVCAALLFLLVAAPASADVAFSTATTLATSTTNPSELVTADFNNDGFADLASADCGDVCGGAGGSTGQLTVLHGNGAGGFSTPPRPPPLPPSGMQSPDILPTADFDDNGRADLAALYNLTNEHAMYLGRDNSTNGFAAPIDEGPDGGGTEGVAAGDVNGDGDVDLVVGRSAAGVAVRLGNGAGNLGAPSTVPGTDAPGFSTDPVTLVDLDRDGDLDMVAGLLDGAVLVMRNNPTGTFTLVDRIGGGDTVKEIDAGDLNQDGDPDLVLAGQARGPTVPLGGSGLTFGPPTTYPSGAGKAEAAVVADFDRDGRLDVAVREDAAATAVGVYKGDGTGSLSRVATLPSSTTEDGQAGLVAPDVNNDGAPDLVTTNSLNHGLSLYRSLPIVAVGTADFDDTATGSRSLERTIAVRNRGSAPLAINAATIGGPGGGDFSETADECTGATVPRGGSCNVTVRFAPTVTGIRAASLTVDPTDPALPNAIGGITGRGGNPPPAPAAGPQGPAGGARPPGSAGGRGAGGAAGRGGGAGAPRPRGGRRRGGCCRRGWAAGPPRPAGPGGSARTAWTRRCRHVQGRHEARQDAEGHLHGSPRGEGQAQRPPGPQGEGLRERALGRHARIAAAAPGAPHHPRPLHAAREDHGRRQPVRDVEAARRGALTLGRPPAVSSTRALHATCRASASAPLRDEQHPARAGLALLPCMGSSPVCLTGQAVAVCA